MILYFCFGWPHRLTVRISGFHPGDRGSIPREATKKIKKMKKIIFTIFIISTVAFGFSVLKSNQKPLKETTTEAKIETNETKKSCCPVN